MRRRQFITQCAERRFGHVVGHGLAFPAWQANPERASFAGWSPGQLGPWQSLRCERIRGPGRQLEREEVMRTILAALLCCWCGHALAQTAQELIDSPKNSENATTFGMGYHLNQYSSLNQINKSNIKRLVPIWSTSLSNDAGELAQPTIYNGVMYVVNGHWTFALDTATGQPIWRTPVEYERAAARVGQPGVIMRGGATIYDGKLFRETIDCHVVALDMKTGLRRHARFGRDDLRRG